MYTGMYFLAVPDVLPDIPGSDRRREPDERLFPDHGMSHDFDEASQRELLPWQRDRPRTLQQTSHGERYTMELASNISNFPDLWWIILLNLNVLSWILECAVLNSRTDVSLIVLDLKVRKWYCKQEVCYHIIPRLSKHSILARRKSYNVIYLIIKINCAWWKKFITLSQLLNNSTLKKILLSKLGLLYFIVQVLS